jgi:hypothetical protein
MTTATEGTQISEVTDDLEAFSAQLYGTGEPTDEKSPPADEGKPAGDGVDERADAADGDEGADTDPEAGDPDAEDGEEKPEEVEKRKRSTSDRIKKLVADKREAERALAELQARVAAAEKPDLTAAKASDTTEALQEPDPAKYKFGELDPQYMRDLAKFEVKSELLAVQREQEQARQTEAANREADQVRQKAAEVTQAGQAKFSDFEEVVVEAALAGEFALTQEMFETAVETAVAPDILYYLAQNPEESAKVAEMNPRQQALWFGRMEAKFSQPAPEPKRKVTTAPPPPASLPKGSGGKGGVSIYDIEDPRALDAMTKALFGKG